MARRPNYDFEKRQKEIAKQKKKEEKDEKKRLRKEAIERGEIVDDGIAWDEAFTGDDEDGDGAGDDASGGR